MKKFTRLLFTLVLLCAVGVMNAQEKVYATFANPTGIAWDAGNSTFSWSAPWGNQLHNIGLPNGNITEYEKVVVDCTILEGDSYRIMFYGNDFGTTAGGITVIAESGKKEYVLADFAMDPGYLTNCSEFCLSGNGASGKVKVNEVYFVKPADPVKLAKGILQKTITAAQTVDGSIYTTDSYDKLKTALAAAQAALNATSVEPVDAANAALTTAINALVYKIGVSDLTKDLFINHDNNQPAGCNYVLNVADGLPYGDGNVFWKNYADLSEYSKLIVTVSAGVPRFCFNRTEDQAQYSGDPKNPKFFSIPNQEFAAEAYQKVSGNVYTIDIAKIVADYGFAYLHCIKGYNGNVTVTGMYLLKVVEGAKDEEDVSGALAELRQAIAQAETVNTESASEYRQGVFSKTLSEAQILVAIAEAGDATVGWIRTMMARIDNAVNMLYVEDPEVIPYEYTPEPVTYKGVKKDLKAAVDAAEATLDANQNKPEALQNTLSTLINQGQTILANDYSKMDQEEFEEMVNTVINRIKAAEEALKNAKEQSTEPEPEVEPLFADGAYFLYNVGTGKYLAAGADWGTHAVVNEVGLDFGVAYLGGGKYTLDSQVSNGGASHFLNGAWNDGVAFGWTFEEVSEGVYAISNGSQYLTARADDFVELGNEKSANAQWQLKTYEDRFATFATATPENGVDATFMIKAWDFSRNDLRNSSWTHSRSGGNETFAGYKDPTWEQCKYFGCEYWNNTFQVEQTVTNLPDGVYEFSISGYGTNNTTYIYANGQQQLFVNTASDANFNTALQNIFSGSHTGNVSGKFNVIGDGTAVIGIKRETNSNKDWTVFDKARLTYYGPASADLYGPAYENALAEAQQTLSENEKFMSEAAKKNLEDAINATVDTEDTKAMQEAIKNLKAASAAGKASAKSGNLLANGVPDHTIEGWTCTTGNDFHVNTWSGEGNSDGSQMTTPFIENWVWGGNGAMINNGAVYYTMEGLDPGVYEASALVRFYSEKGMDPTGGSFYAENGTSQSLLMGTSFEFNNMKGVYGTYHAAAEVGKDGVFRFGVKAENATFNWFAIKNISVKQVDSKRLSELANEKYMAELLKVISECKSYLAIQAYQNKREELEHLISVSEKDILGKPSTTVSTILTMIDDMRAALAAYLAANKLVVEPGKAYIKNVATGKWWGVGNDWGTRASLVDHPAYVTLDMPASYYTMETQVSNTLKDGKDNGTAYYFEGDYMDNANAKHLTIEEKGRYVLISSGGQYYGYDGNSTILGKNIDPESTEALWEVFTEDQMKNQLANASVANPVDATWLILDPNFGRNQRNKLTWTITANNKNLGGGDVTNYCAESYKSEFNLSQVLSNAPKGVYQLTAQAYYRVEADGTDEILPVIYANEATSPFQLRTGTENSMTDASHSFSSGLYEVEPVYVEVAEDGALTVGAKLEGNSTLWSVWDNFALTYYGADASIDEVKNSSVFIELAKLVREGEALVDQVEVTKVKTALSKAIEAGKAAKSLDECNAAMADLKEAVAAAEGSVKAKDVLPKMKELVEMNNIATAEALEEYYGQWVTKYQEGTITKAEASALQDPTVLTGWHASLTCDNYLLSAWDAEPDFQSPYYINTWSVEGDNDGTNFHVPFIEYWTGDDSSLGEKTMTAAIDGVPAGKYTVEAWVRVRMKNSGSAPTYGINMQANGSNPVDVCDGEESTDGSSTFFNKVYQIPVTIGADGALTVSFDIASDNNVSWLAIKNVRYFDPNATGIKTVGTQKAAGQIFNLQGQRVNKATKGVFIQDGKIILKK